MVKSNYVPEKGDLVWLDFDPQAGHEQKGRRPAICVSQKIYNKKIGLASLCIGGGQGTAVIVKR